MLLTPQAGLAYLRARQAAREPVIADEPRPSIDDVVTISPDAEADYLGYSLVMAGEDANPPAGWPMAQLVAFFDGVCAAWRRQAEDELARGDLESWLDTLARPEPDWDGMYPDFDPHHEAERVEAVGVIAARKGGGR